MDRVVLLSLLALATLCGSTNPGVKVRVTKSAINYANQLAHAQIVQQLKTLSIPDQSGQDGHISYSLSSIRVQGVTPPGSAINLVPGKNGISWTLTNFGIALKADWRVKYRKKFVKISTSGSVDASLSGVSVAETAAFGIDKTGRPSIASSGCSSNIGGVSLRFHGGTSFIINLFRHTLERKVREMLQPKICEQVVQVINKNAAQSLATMTVTVQLAKRFLVDYRLVAAPLITTDFLELSDKGEIFWEADLKESPFSPKPIPPWTDNSRMIYIWVTDYTPNTFLYQGYTHGYLRYNVTKKDLPADKESYLNTTCTLKCIGTIIPQIGKKYPNSVVEIGLEAVNVPNTTLTKDEVTTRLNTKVVMWARTPKNEVYYLCTLSMNISLTLKPSIKDGRLNAVISDHSFKLTLIKSDVGTLVLRALTTVVGGVLDYVVIPKLNKIVAIGVDLPMVDGVELSNTNLLLQEGNLLISTDLQYKPGSGKCNALRFQAGQEHHQYDNIYV